MNCFKSNILLALIVSSCWTVVSAKYLDIGGDYKSFEAIKRKPASIDVEWNSFFKVHSTWNNVLKDYWTDSRFIKLQDVLNDQVQLCNQKSNKVAQGQCINEKEQMILKDGLGQYQLFLISELSPNLVLTKDKMSIGECSVYTSDKDCVTNLIDEVFSDSIRVLWQESYAINFPQQKSVDIIFKNFKKYQKNLIELCKESFKEDDKERCAKHVEFAVARDQIGYWSQMIVSNKVEEKSREHLLKLFQTSLDICFDSPFQNQSDDEEWQRLYNYEISEYSILATDCLQQSVKQLAYLRSILSLKENMSALSGQLRLAPLPQGLDFINLTDLDDMIFEEVLKSNQYSRLFEETSFDNLKIKIDKSQLFLGQDYALSYLITNFDNKQFRYLLSDARINGALTINDTDLMLAKDKILHSLSGSEILSKTKLSSDKKYFSEILNENIQGIEAQLKQLEWPSLENELKKSGVTEEDLKNAGNIFEDYPKWAKGLVASITGYSDAMIESGCFNVKENLNYNVLKCLRADLEKNHQVRINNELKNELVQFFSKYSREYSEILEEVGLISYCYREISSFGPIHQQWQQIKNCEKVIRFNFAHNIDRAVAFSYTPMILQKDWQKIDENLNYCYSMSLMENGIADLNSVFINSKKIHDGKMNVLEFFKGNEAFAYSAPEFLLSLKDDQNKLRQFLKKDLTSWPGNKVLECRESAKKLTFESFQEFVIMNFSGELKRTLLNRKGEAVDFVLKSLFNVEFMDVLMAVPEIEGKNTYVTRKKVLNALSNSILKLSGFMQKGFVFDRDRMKTELVVIRSQLMEFLTYVKSENRLVETSEIGDFFSESSLPEFLAVSFMSELLHNKFVKYIEIKKADALSVLVREYPSYGDAKKQAIFSQKRLELLNKFKVWQDLGERLINAQDFRRVMNVNSDDSAQFLIYLKKRMIPEIVIDGDMSSATQRDFARLASEIFVKDNTPDGIVGVLAREYLQKLLYDKKDNYWFFSSKDSWWIRRKFFNKEEAFNWDSLAKTSEGQAVLDFYTRYLFLPEFMEEGLEYTVKKGREEVFKEKLEALSVKMR
jgi:hypothetical protein